MIGLNRTNYNLPNQSKLYRGKVRDNYYVDEYIVIISSDRISAFDVVLPNCIPYKGEILNQIATKNLLETKDICPNWLISVPDPNVSIGWKCEPIPIEIIVRAYLCGHSWREYKLGKRNICGNVLPNGLNENDPLPKPIITPTTKATNGHDQDISKDEIINKNIVSDEIFLELEKYSMQLFERGSSIAKENNLILVDTKYEFGIKNNQVLLIDEIHTPDSSRYFYLDKYHDNQKKHLPQRQLSKEFVREWLIKENYIGLEEQSLPIMDNKIINQISERYIELYEWLMKKKFVKHHYDNIEERIFKNIMNYFKQNQT